MTLRLTQRALKWFRKQPGMDVLPATSRLVDWYGNILFTKHYRLLMCTSAESLLTILVPVKLIKSLENDIPRHIWKYLISIGVEGKVLEKELEQMIMVNIGKTQNRSILGAMNDMAFNAEILLERQGRDLYRTIELLNDTPYSTIKMKFPKDKAINRLKYWEIGQFH